MKKLFTKAVLGVCALGTSTVAFAQEAAEAVAPVEGSMHQALKTKFIEGDASFMSLVAIALILGLAFVLERIIYLNLADVNPNGMLNDIEAALDRGDVEGAKAIARDTRGPIASIAYIWECVVFCASSRITKASSKVRPLINAKGAISITFFSINVSSFS